MNMKLEKLSEMEAKSHDMILSSLPLTLVSSNSLLAWQLASIMKRPSILLEIQVEPYTTHIYY